MGGHRKFLEGGGVLKVKILEAKYEAKLEFPGGTGGAKQKTFHEGSMDIFWNCTILYNFLLKFESRSLVRISQAKVQGQRERV